MVRDSGNQHRRWGGMETPGGRCPPFSTLPSHQEFPFRSQGVDHAELCFLYWFYDQVLKVMSPREEFRITWYMSWSPCFVCAEQVARFLATHHNLSLAIFCSRFYYPNYPQKLCSLIQEGAQVAAMDLPGEEWAQRHRRACGSAIQ